MYQPDEMPEHLEAGTVNTPGIIGLGQGIEYINNFGIDRIRKHKHQLIERFHVEFAHNDNICIYSENNIEKNSGIFAFNIKGFDPQKVGRILDEQYDIAIRAGLHCAPLAHKTVGAPETGEVRISVGCFNTMEEVESTIEALQTIADKKIPQELPTVSV
jgi:selenocysteine lyase/cysteine desulfurase